MNQKLVESLAQIILSLSDEERQLLENKVQISSVSKQLAELENRLKNFEQRYHMMSESFYQRFQSGELGDSMDFFEWNTYYEMWKASQAKVS
jgi:chromosome segregation ATPase